MSGPKVAINNANKNAALKADTGRLWVGQIDERFDPERDVLLGFWCLTGAEDIYPEWERLTLNEPFESSRDLVAHTVDLNALCRYFLGQLRDRLNDHHGVSYSINFWRLLAMPWLIDLTYLAWYRWLEVEHLEKAACTHQLKADLLPDDLTWHFQSYTDFNATTLTDLNFSAWIAARILKHKQPAGVEFGQAPHPPKRTANSSGYIRPPKTGFHALARRLRSALRAERCAVGSIGNEYSLSTKVRSMIAEATLGLFINVLPAKHHLVLPNPDEQPSIPARFPSEFVDIVASLIDKTMPRMLTDQFIDHLRKAEKSKFRPGKIWIRTSSFYIDPPTLFRIATSIERGEILLSSQHGGTYGSIDAHQFPGETEYRNHAFLTWGWREHSAYSGNFIPLPSAQLAAWQHERRPHNGSLVVVAQALRFMPGRISSEGDIFNRQFSRHARVNFFKGLPPGVRNQVRYRPYDGIPAMVSDMDYFLARFPDLSIIRENFHKQLIQSRLVVVDYPGTTICQAMAANIPTVGFWSHEAYRMCPQAEPIYEAMRRVGLIHHTGESAAAHIAEIWDDVEGWWTRPDVREAREMFCAQFAKTERLWLWQWMKALWRL